MKIIKSEIDNSANFIIPAGDGGFFEARYVRRSNDYFICYLSSHSGCNRGCAFCHLTATKQFTMKPALVGYSHYVNEPEFQGSFIHQAMEVFKHYIKQPRAETVHFNWMARGEPLDNPSLDFYALKELGDLAFVTHLKSKFNISTIMPKGFDGKLADRFNYIYPTMYYSLYSLNPEFRAKWLPGAMDPLKALDLLAEYQQVSQKIIKLHGCFIKGENDDWRDWCNIIMELSKRDIMCKFNVVRFNPPPGDSHEEADMKIIQDIASELGANGYPTKIVERVDPKTYGSCGMFPSPAQVESLPDEFYKRQSEIEEEAPFNG